MGVLLSTTSFIYTPVDDVGPGNQGSQGNGAQGPQGVPGQQGPQGVPGSGTGNGSQGPQGFQGASGSGGTGNGSQGAQGAQGPQGSSNGPQGPQGYQGVQGYQGYQGIPGSGSQGSQGSQGATGAIGPSGGAQGPQGSQGNDGNTGPTGPTGQTGPTGPAGGAGPTGAQGQRGNTGVAGPQGNNGVDGTQGNQGYQGFQGNNGVDGNQGNQGYQGNNGVQGNQGYQGADGTQGNQGATGANGVDYFNDTNPTPVTIGGIPAGTTFVNASVQTMFQNLLYPYQYPAFTSFSINGQSTALEVGTTISGSHTFVWSTTNNVNIQTNSISITDQSYSTVLGSALPNTGSYTTILSSVQLTSPGYHQWGIQGTNTNSNSFFANFAVSWYWRVYYGDNTNTILAESDILGLSGNFLASSGSATYSLSPGGYKYICYPSSFGAANSIKDTSTNLNVAMADTSDDPSYSNNSNGYYYALVSVTNTFGQTIDYRVYRSKNVLGGSINIQVS
jgi:hypothetical protein